MNNEDLDVRSFGVGHQPTIRPCMEQCHIFNVLTEYLPRHMLAEAYEAELGASLVLNRPSGSLDTFSSATNWPSNQFCNPRPGPKGPLSALCERGGGHRRPDRTRSGALQSRSIYLIRPAGRLTAPTRAGATLDAINLVALDCTRARLVNSHDAFRDAA
jgi:hypothetical protein